MTRALSFAALASMTVLLAACGAGDDDAATVITPESAGASSETGAAQPAPDAAPRTDMAAAKPKPEPGSGADIFAKQCAWCHSPGVEHPGTMQLGETRGADFAVLEDRTDLNADYVKYIVRNGLNGMPPFKPTIITDAELDKLASYLAAAE